MIGFLLGFAMFGAMNFLPLFQQTVQGASATNSGLLLLPLMFGMLVVSHGRRPGDHQDRPVPDLPDRRRRGDAGRHGPADPARRWTPARPSSSLYMVVLGVGMGFLMQTSMLIAQNSVEQKDLGAASGAATFFRSIGGSFGISLFGAIFANRLADVRRRSVPAPAGGSGGGGMDPDDAEGAAGPVREAVLGGLADSIVGRVRLGGAVHRGGAGAGLVHQGDPAARRGGPAPADGRPRRSRPRPHWPTRPCTDRTLESAARHPGRLSRTRAAAGVAIGRSPPRAGRPAQGPAAGGEPGAVGPGVPPADRWASSSA